MTMSSAKTCGQRKFLVDQGRGRGNSRTPTVPMLRTGQQAFFESGPDCVCAKFMITRS